MPFALAFIGLLLIITGFQDSYKALGNQVQKDFTGPQSFIYWLISLGLIGALGYVPELKTFSRLTLGFIIIVIFVAYNKQGINLFQNFNSGIATGDTSTVSPIGTPLPATASASGSAGSSTGGGASGIIGDVTKIFGL